jgi:hypothetical protein
MNAFDYIREIGECVSRIPHKRMVSQEILIYINGMSILGWNIADIMHGRP